MRLKRFFSRFEKKLRSVPLSGSNLDHSVHYLNFTQFFGALNDNIFKLLVIFLLIARFGPSKATLILSLAGAIFVVPFLLFSHAAGVLADRFRKQTIIVWVKAAEIVIILFAFVAFAFQSAWASYSLLFLLAAQSAVFGPSKYGIIPELVPERLVPKANGLITSFTYLAIILGTFFGSFLTEITNRNFVLADVFCFAVAIAGFVLSLRIKKTAAQGSSKKVHPFVLREIYRTLKFCRTQSHLITVMLAASFFLFIGAFTQLNIIPYAMEGLNLSEVAGGYLFLSTALGIALGAYLSGKLTHKKIDLAVPWLAAFFFSIFFLLLYFSSSSLILSIVFLVLIGISGGFFIVPLDSFIQLRTPEEKRGEVIATTNFLSFIGVFLSACALYFFAEGLKLSAAGGFILISFFSMIATTLLFFRFSDDIFPFFGRILKSIYSLHTRDLALITKSEHPVIILQEATPTKALLLMSVFSSFHLFIPKEREGKKYPFRKLFFSLHMITGNEDIPHHIQIVKKKVRKDMIPCLYINRAIAKKEDPHGKMFNLSGKDVFFASLQRKDRFKSFWSALFKAQPTDLIFSKHPIERKEEYDFFQFS